MNKPETLAYYKEAYARYLQIRILREYLDTGKSSYIDCLWYLSHFEVGLTIKNLQHWLNNHAPNT